ncbi:MAG: oxidoreductase [Sterolibacterium sp.]|jgi:uncharacterized protein YbjT (DUF2867 family)|nr:oxidoreductase [Sterolibacterium sp.]
MSKHALIAGASGLVGGQLLDELLNAPEYTQVTAVLRRPLPITHPKLVQLIIDFERLALTPLPAADSFFCCLGTTLKAAGSKAAFRHIDHDYVMNLAQQARHAGAQQFLLVSSTGAHARSAFFYMRTKGEIENALRAEAFASSSVFRPAYLVGQRPQGRPIEDLYGKLMQRMACCMPPAYRPISARAVARAMLAQSRLAPPGFHVIESAALQRFELRHGFSQP